MADKAYSYARWSSARQGDGHSLERQLSRAKAYAADHNLDLDTSMVDDAVSAFRGDNLAFGELARFCEQVKAGAIPQGSYLLIDSYDRFSRDVATVSVERLLAIVNAGVHVVTLSNREVFRKGDTKNLIYAVFDLERAHGESRDKSDKVKKAHASDKERARNENRPWTPAAPSWLSVKKKGIQRGKIISHDVISERRDVIVEIFDLYESGVPSTAIARMLNSRKVKTHDHFRRISNPTKLNGEPRKPISREPEWSSDSVIGTLTNRMVIGEYQPHEMDRAAPRGRRPHGPPIKDFYPAIVDEAQFLRVQAKIRGRSKRPRQHSPKAFRNIFINIGRCSECGGVFSLHSNTNYDNRNRIPRLRCIAAHHGGRCSNRLRLPYPIFEAAFLSNVVDFEVPGEVARIGTARSELDDALLKLEDIEREAETYKSQLHSGDNIFVTKWLEDAQSRYLKISSQIKNLKSKVLEESIVLNPKKDQDSLSSLLSSMARLEGDDLYALRARLSDSIRNIVERINFHPDGTATIYIKGFRKAYKIRDGILVGSVDSAPAGEEHPLYGLRDDIVPHLDIDEKDFIGILGNFDEN